jgi:hypothetical protein
MHMQNNRATIKVNNLRRPRQAIANPCNKESNPILNSLFNAISEPRPADANAQRKILMISRINQYTIRLYMTDKNITFNKLII